MSQIEAGKLAEFHAPFDLLSLVEDCSSIILGQLAGKQIDFVTDLGGVQHTSLVGDALHLKQIFVNILGNSVKFTREGGRIVFRISEISCDGEAVMFCFVFEDNGVGMSEEFLPTLFEEFSQDIEQSRTNYKGTGLGMAITKQYVEMLRGTIQVESKLDVGTRFVIEMPISIDHTRESTTTQLQGGPVLTGRQILLAEDNELNAEIAVEMLEEEGAIVTVAENGKLAVELFEKSEASYFDLILMDIMMPEMNGLEATQAIRQLNRWDAQRIPIIAMTANAFEEDKRAALEAGMNAHIAKPVDVKVLMRVLHETLAGV
jgi:CheY-like chemotaxis protein